MPRRTARRPLTKADLEAQLLKKEAKIDELNGDIERIALSRSRARARYTDQLERNICLQEKLSVALGAIERQKHSLNKMRKEMQEGNEVMLLAMDKIDRLVDERDAALAQLDLVKDVVSDDAEMVQKIGTDLLSGQDVVRNARGEVFLMDDESDLTVMPGNVRGAVQFEFTVSDEPEMPQSTRSFPETPEDFVWLMRDAELAFGKVGARS